MPKTSSGRHYHRNGKIMVVSGVLYYGISESKSLWAGENGTFVNTTHPDGGYKGLNTDKRYYKICPKRGLKEYAHRIIYEVVHNQEIPPGLEIDHINGNRHDNAASNLRVVSHLDNVRNPNTIHKNQGALLRSAGAPERRAAISARMKTFYASEAGRKDIARRAEINREKSKKRMLDPDFKAMWDSERQKRNELNKKPVIGTELDSGEEKIFDSVSAAAKFMGLTVSDISCACRGKPKTRRGWWAFRFADKLPQRA